MNREVADPGKTGLSETWRMENSMSRGDGIHPMHSSNSQDSLMLSS